MWRCPACDELIGDGLKVCPHCDAEPVGNPGSDIGDEAGEAAPESPFLAELVEMQPNYWGPWATVGLSLAVAAIYLAGNVVAVVGLVVTGGVPDLNDPALAPGSNGLILSVCSLVSAPFVIGPILLFIRIRPGISVRQYLSLWPVPASKLMFWLSVTALAIVCGDLSYYATGQDVVPRFVRDAWQTAGWLPLLWLALIVAAPLVEEVFFRGFLFVGLQRSRLGNTGAILITSAIWAALHTQYEFYLIAHIFIIGVLFGIARVRAKSLYVPMAMHGLMNLVATLEAAWVMS
jgi:membrane protease YdiL (CAAX protease family)